MRSPSRARAVAATAVAVLLGALIAHRAYAARVDGVAVLLVAYAAVVLAYLASRFALALAYRPPPDAARLPAVAIVMPAFNEEEAIAASLRALLASDYPPELLEIVAVDDGSTDATHARMSSVAAAARGRIRLVRFPENRGKRAAMAAGIRATRAEVVAFVDSDSQLDPDAVRRIVRSFADPRVGAVCGHAEVLNPDASWLTRMQAVRYFVAFRVMKAAESVFGTVTCCSGCFAAYRRCAITPHLDAWEHQRFLGRNSTFGDDRALTNRVLRTMRVVYDSGAVARTLVPVTARTFLRQQARWKRSWTRESLIVGRFAWRKHPAAAAAIYVGMLVPLVAPAVAARALFWGPFAAGALTPLIYAGGLLAMALVYCLAYVVMRGRFDRLWLWGIAFVAVYVVVLVWQTWYAILTARRASWGTRPTTAGLAGGPGIPEAVAA